MTTSPVPEEPAAPDAVPGPLPPTAAPTFTPPAAASTAKGRDVIGSLAADPPSFRRRVWLPLFLFVVTCFTTFMAGCYHWYPAILGKPAPLQDAGGALVRDRAQRIVEFEPLELVQRNWRDGLLFMASVMGVLLLHEMGHFVMTIRHRIPASYPYFIPMPVMITGTMGAVIGMEGSRANRKELFDIGLAGPLAGLVLTVPLVVIGILTARPVEPHSGVPLYGSPLLAQFLANWLTDLPPGIALQENALYMAGWVGMLVTGLNMLPVSQLDGGHVAYAVLGRYARWLGRALIVAAVALIVLTDNAGWTVMLLIVLLIGVDHPPTADDTVKIGPLRWTLGLVSLLIPVVCFTPVPLGIMH